MNGMTAATSIELRPNHYPDSDMENYNGNFDGGTIAIFRIGSAPFHAYVRWELRGIEIKFSSLSESKTFDTIESAFAWCNEVIETGPDLALDVYRTATRG